MSTPEDTDIELTPTGKIRGMGVARIEELLATDPAFRAVLSLLTAGMTDVDPAAMDTASVRAGIEAGGGLGDDRPELAKLLRLTAEIIETSRAYPATSPTFQTRLADLLNDG